MYRSDCNQFYALEGLYEDWVALRDHVLFNPHVGVSIDIGVLPRYADPHAPHQLDLRPYKSLPDEGFVATANAREVALRLIERCILVYIAFSSEPIRAADVGWSISQLSLRNGAFEDLEHLYRQPYVTDGMLAWPTLDEPVALRRELERVVDGAAVRDRIRSVRSTIQGAIPGPPDMVGREFDNNDLLVEVKQPDNESGYYFNGDLEICVPTFQTYTPAPEEEQRVAFFALGEELTLECLDGRAVGVEQLRARFVDSGVPVHVESADPFSTLERVLHRDFVDATAIMLAPANEDMLQRFIDPSNRAHWISLMGERRVPTILVLDHNVRVRERGTIDQLREDGIELMYPSPLPDALDLTKMLDHVVCAGHRTRYLGLRRDPAAADVSAREFAAAEFLEHFRILLGMGYDGDPRSGSMSKRLGRGPRFAISTTKTDKSSLGADGVAIVESYSLATNELVWSGTQRPSSTSPWHSLIYAAFPEIKYIVHTHWKDITYHDALAEFRTPRYVPTGHPAEAADVVTTLVATRGRHGLGGLFAILADHGEVFIGRSPAEMLKTVHVARQRAGSGVFS
jgi:ribulose-5-phosphate 4-epimerase/fuculose-1-phosphate aldolase